MKVNEFIKMLNSTSNIQIVRKAINVKSYLPYLEKQRVANDIFENSIIMEHGYIKIDQIKKYLVFTTKTIEAYTDLEFDENYEKMAAEYDSLVESGRLSIIVEAIGAEYNTVLDLVRMVEDTRLVENSLEYKLALYSDYTVNSATSIMDFFNIDAGNQELLKKYDEILK